MNKIDKAFMVAEKAHANQTYGDVFPYIYHVKEVYNIAKELGFDEEILIASILHDVLEDSDLSYNDIKKIFGEAITEIVYCVTDELGRNRKERKEKTLPKIKANWKATVVKICDRIANVSHSKEHSNRMFEMYKKEQKLFVTELTCDEHPKHEMSKAWSMLNKLFY